MVINKNLCVGCGECVTECPRKAIVSDGSDKYKVEAEMCNNCEDRFDVECIRICAEKAFAADDGTVPEFDPTCRIRSEHLLWLMSILGAKGSGIYKDSHWDGFRKIISAAYLDPDLEVRLTRCIDDTCVKCRLKQNLKHLEESGALDDVCFERLGVKPGTVMRLWDAVQLVEDKFSLPFIQEHKIISGDNLGCLIAFISRDAKMLTNEA